MISTSQQYLRCTALVRGVLRGEVWQYRRKSSEDLGPVTAACRHRAGGMRVQYKFINDWALRSQWGPGQL